MKVSRDQLQHFIDKLERLEEEKNNVSTDIKEVMAEAKSYGFDTKIIKKVLKIRKTDRQKLEEEEMLLDTYLSALGMSHRISEDA